MSGTFEASDLTGVMARISADVMETKEESCRLITTKEDDDSLSLRTTHEF